MRPDYYQLLDATPQSTPQELKAAYYRLAKRYHPDYNAGDPAAEERFKLVAEAYRTLGVPERRREYDNWLRLHELCPGASELEAFGAAKRVRPFHFSSRRAQERQQRRSGVPHQRPRSRRLFRTLPFSSSAKLNTWLFIGFYALIAFNLLPVFFRQMFASPAPVVRKTSPAQAEQVDEVEARRRIMNMEQSLRTRASAGEVEACYQLGLYLFHKSSRGRGEGANPTVLRRAASEGYRREALHWLHRAAGQGHAAAQRLLNRLELPPSL